MTWSSDTTSLHVDLRRFAWTHAELAEPETKEREFLRRLPSMLVVAA